MKLSAKLLLACLSLTVFAQAEVASVPEFDKLMTDYVNDVQLRACPLKDANFHN
jgi:hypothetical protein